jgi:hypothetical protein
MVFFLLGETQAMSGPIVPPGQSPPFEVIDDTHRGGVIIIIAACTLVLSLVGCIIRAYVRLILSPPFGLDDVLLVGGTVSYSGFWLLSILASPAGNGRKNNLADLSAFFSQLIATVQSCLLFVNVSRGLGTSIDLLNPQGVRGIQQVCSWQQRDPQSCNAH